MPTTLLLIEQVQQVVQELHLTRDALGREQIEAIKRRKDRGWNVTQRGFWFTRA